VVRGMQGHWPEPLKDYIPTLRIALAQQLDGRQIHIHTLA